MHNTELASPATRPFIIATRPTPATGRRWNPVSISIIVLAWLILHIGCLFSPGLLDDVDSVYIEIAREMLQRHDLVTPYIDGIRFFDKPPLMYWVAAASMHLFGAHVWAARLPLALFTLGLFVATYALGLRLFAEISPRTHPDRGALYSALVVATCIGTYLYTRFFIPDILLALWMTLAVHLFLIALGRVSSPPAPRVAQLPLGPLLPMLAFAAVMALNVLTKGLIGVVFPVGFVLLYLALTRQLPLLKRLHPVAAISTFLVIAAPWHILAALRNPAISLPAGLGLPAHGGWAWFYLYNEHIARFLSRRIPHDYGQVPIPLFWCLAFVWLIPWAVFLPGAIAHHLRELRHRASATPRQREAAISLLLWAAVVLGFFTLSARQEYYSLPAIPALALMVGGLLARAEAGDVLAQRFVRRGATFFLLPLATAVALICGYFGLTAPTLPANVDVAAVLTSNPDEYNLALGHLYDLTGHAMGFFRAPLLGVAASMLGIALTAWLLRRRSQAFAAIVLLAGFMTGVLLCVHSGLARFYPIIGSESLALEVDRDFRPGDRIMIDGWLTWGSTLLFYTHQPVSLVNGRIYGPWFGSFWPDSPAIFENDDSLRRAWAGPQRIFLMIFDSRRPQDLQRFGPVFTLSTSGGKSIISNRPNAPGPPPA